MPIPSSDEQQRIADFLDSKTQEIGDAIAKKERLIELLREQNLVRINQAVTQGLNPDAPMQDSGIDWIGHIPMHWNIMANRALFVERKVAGRADLPILTVSLHTGVSDQEQTGEENVRAMIRIEDKSSYKYVDVGDIAYNMMRAWQGAIGVVNTEGMVSPAYVVARPCKKLNGEYFEYLYRTSAFIQQMDRYSKGITDFRKRLYWDEFKQLITLVPPPEEQDAIIRYIRQISDATGKVQESIKREIAALKEMKTVLISEAVTGKIKV